MNISMSGGSLRRRWGRLLAGAACIAIVGGCATNGRDARIPPEQCSRSKARPANPHGSILSPPGSAQAAPANGTGSNDVMIFGNGADRAPARSAPAPSGENLGRPNGRAPGAKRASPRKGALVPKVTGSAQGMALHDPRQARFGSC